MIRVGQGKRKLTSQGSLSSSEPGRRLASCPLKVVPIRIAVCHYCLGGSCLPANAQYDFAFRVCPQGVASLAEPVPFGHCLHWRGQAGGVIPPVALVAEQHVVGILCAAAFFTDRVFGQVQDIRLGCRPCKAGPGNLQA